MQAPEVSVIMPAYNAEVFIEQSIESVIAQTYSNWELLIVDDGSTDNTKMNVEKFCAKDSRIKYYYQSNGKAGKARNLAMKHAIGKYVAFLDSDDIWFPQKVELQLKQLEEKNADLVFSDGVVFKENLTDAVAYKNAGKGYFIGEAGVKILLEQNNIPLLTVLAKKEIIDAVNGFTENPKIPRAEDYHLWLKLLMKGYIFFGSEEELAAYRDHFASSSSNDKLSISCVIEAFEELKKEYKPYSSLINKYQKRWFNKYHFSTNNWSKKDYKNLIKKNCIYLNKVYLLFVFKMLYFISGMNVTRKMINMLLNNYAKA